MCMVFTYKMSNKIIFLIIVIKNVNLSAKLTI